MLQTLDLGVQGFTSAEEFLQTVDGGTPDCLITEVHLPGMTGIDLQKHLKERGIHLPVIVLATNADVPVAVRAMHLGALDFIEKPFIDRVVVARVKEALALAG